MRHIPNFIIRAVLICISTMMLVACDGDSIENILLFKSVGDPNLFEEDIDQDVDPKTLDIVVDSSEELALLVQRANLLTFLETPLYRYLDVNEFPSDIPSTCLNNNDAENIYASFSSSRPAGEGYQVGDIVDVEFNNCLLESGQEVTGSFSIEYDEVEGINDRFTPIDTDYCIERVQALEEGEGYPIEFLGANELVFRPFGSNTIVEAYEYSYDNSTGNRIDTLRASRVIPRDQKTLIVMESLDVNETALVSMTSGDQIYLLHNGRAEIQSCQDYQREMSVEVENLVVTHNEITTTLDGKLNFTNDAKDITLETFNIVESDMIMSVKDSVSYNDVSLRDFNVNKWEDSERGTYAISMSGLLTLDNGEVVSTESNLSNPYSGALGELPTSGQYNIYGVGDSAVIMFAYPKEISFSVRYAFEELSRVEGYRTIWSNFLSRGFRLDDFIVE